MAERRRWFDGLMPWRSRAPGFVEDAAPAPLAPPAPRRGFGDTLQNLVAGLMTRADKSAWGRYIFRGPIPPDELEAMYRSNWLARKICDAPAEDMTREWINLETADADGREELESAESDFALIERITDTIRWARLYGGCALYPSIAGHDPATPLEISAIRPGSLRGFIVLDRWQLTPAPGANLRIDLARPDFARPEFYLLNAVGQQRIHVSRLFFMDGAQLPYRTLRQNNFWSDSVLQAIYDEMQRDSSVAAGTASMLFEACIDIIKVANLAINLASEDGTATVTRRFELAALLKSINHMLLLDAEDDYQQRTITFAGLPDLLSKFMARLAGAADIPATRLFGVSPTGMNSTGESDTRNYYDGLKSRQERRLRPILEIAYDIMAMSRLGRVLDDLVIEFNPLWQLEAKELAQTELFRAQRDEIYNRIGVVPEALMADRLRANDTYPLTDDDIDELRGLAEYMAPPAGGASAASGYQSTGNAPPVASAPGGPPIAPAQGAPAAPG